jgi:hypothetical protein
MAILYPGTPPGSAFDVFTVPTEPEGTPLSSAGTSDRNHPELHDDIGNAVETLERFTALSIHDHSGDPDHVAKGSKLPQANTHEDADTDEGPTAIHHTIGTGPGQVAAGNHSHPAYVSNRQLCTSLTRPVSPFTGMEIFETDTNATRVWMKGIGQSAPIWQLVPVTLIPVVRVEARTTTTVTPNIDHACAWTHVLEDWFLPFFSVTTDATALTVTEPGLYDITAAVNWDPQATFHDQSMIAITVNGQDIGRKNWEYIRGFSFTPGFSQTNEIHITWRLKANDVVRATVRHNAAFGNSSILWFNNAAPNKQVNHLEAAFRSP